MLSRPITPINNRSSSWLRLEAGPAGDQVVEQAAEWAAVRRAEWAAAVQVVREWEAGNRAVAVQGAQAPE
jgi:hypothetical protein